MRANARTSFTMGVEMALVSLILIASAGFVSSTSEREVALANVTRFASGDIFSLIGSDCGPTRCMEVSHGTALSAMNDGDGCVCQCRKDTPAYREDQRTCVNHIEECLMASFGRGTTKPLIPFVFLPLKGQIIYPSKEIIFTDVEDAICAVTSAQFLSGSGWVTLRDLLDNDVPFSLYRDEGSTFLQWRGSTALHARLEGHLVAVHVLCSAMTPARLVASCAAFRIAGASHNSLLDVRSIPFHAGEVVAPETANQNQGLTVLEALAIGVCVLMLIFIYAAGIIFYIHYKKRQKKKDNDPENNGLSSENGSTLGSRIDLDNVMLKTNPLLKMDSFGVDFGVSDSGLSDLSEHTEYTMDSSSNSQHSPQFQKINSSVISAMVHTRRMKKPSRPSIRMSTTPDRLAELLQRRSASPDIERAPHSELAIVDCMENNSPIREPSPPTIGEPGIRRKLYFNPVFFETELLKNPPPAAVEFLEKIREVMSIAKDKMTTKRYIPSLSDIPEEESYHTIDLGWDFPCARRGRRFSAFSLKRENSRKSAGHCSGCPGCDNQEPLPKPDLTRSNSCKSCASEDYKQRIVRKWLDEVPSPSSRAGITRPVKSIAKVNGTPRVVSPKPRNEDSTNSSESTDKSNELEDIGSTKMNNVTASPTKLKDRLIALKQKEQKIEKENDVPSNEGFTKDSRPILKDIKVLREPKIVNHIVKPLKQIASKEASSKLPNSPAVGTKGMKQETLGISKSQISSPIMSCVSDSDTSSNISMHSLERIRNIVKKSQVRERPMSPANNIHNMGERTKSPLGKLQLERPMSPGRKYSCGDRPMSPGRKHSIGERPMSPINKHAHERAMSPIYTSKACERPMSPVNQYQDSIVIGDRARSPTMKFPADHYRATERARSHTTIHSSRPMSPVNKLYDLEKATSSRSDILSRPKNLHIVMRPMSPPCAMEQVQTLMHPCLPERAKSPTENKERRIPSNHASRRIRKRLPPPPPPPVNGPKFLIPESQSQNDQAAESATESIKSEEAPIPPEVKVKMEAVIRELNDCRRSETNLAIDPKENATEPIPPKIVIPVAAPPDVHYFSDDNVLSDIKKNPVYVQRESFVDFDSMERAILKKRRFSLASGPELAQRGGLIRAYDLKTAKDTLTRSWRDVRRAVENYHFMSHSSVTGSRKSSISEIFSQNEPIYDNLPKPGPLTIQVRGSPVENRCSANDEFDPDTLDRKPCREVKKRIEKILLKSGGSFKHKAVTQDVTGSNQTPEQVFDRKIGSLRQIYEAKAKEEENRKSKNTFYERRSSLPYVGEELSALVKSVKTSEIIRQLEAQKEHKPPIAPKFRRGVELSPKFSKSARDSPGEKRRTSEERERYCQYLKENVANRRSGRRSNRTRSRRTDLRKIYRTEDSGYLSTDSNESKRRANYLIQLKPRLFDHTSVPTVPTVVRTPILPHIESDTDDMESICDGRSESGGESIETDSVFFGNFDESKQMLAELGMTTYDTRGKFQRHEQIDSGFMGETNIILSGDSDSEHRSVISIMTGRDGRASAASISQLDEPPYVHSNC